MSEDYNLTQPCPSAFCDEELAFPLIDWDLAGTPLQCSSCKRWYIWEWETSEDGDSSGFYASEVPICECCGTPDRYLMPRNLCLKYHNKRFDELRGKHGSNEAERKWDDENLKYRRIRR